MNEQGEYLDAPLVRFEVQRLVPDPTGLNRQESNPVIAPGNWVSMPYLVGAHAEAHARYQKDRLFTVMRLEPESRVIVEDDGSEMALVLGQPVVLNHAGEDIRVRVVGFTSRSVLRQAESA